MISFQQVTKRYENGHQALSHVSFEMEEGSMMFLTGHSGAGKSTVLKLLALLDKPNEGKIYLKGKDITRIHGGEIPYYRRYIGMVFQEAHLLEDRTVFDNVALPLIIAGFRPQEITRRVRGALDKVGLLNKERSYSQGLSTGEKQRVGIARAVVNKPAIILADEPTGNLDASLSQDIMALFRQFNELGATLLIASHDQELMRQMNCPMLTLHQGRLVSKGSGAYE